MCAIKINSNVNYGLISDYDASYRFIESNKCTTLVGMLIMGEDMCMSVYAWGVGGGIWEISLTFAQF